MAGRARSPQQAAFFKELKDWSEIKLRILTKYFDAYQKIRGSSNTTLYYIDGFAGAGWYGDDEVHPKEGSPVRLARLAQEIADSGKSYRLICLNYEINPDWFATLQRALSGFDPALVKADLGAFEDHLPNILTTIGTAPALFFLDPFGVRAIELAKLRPILQRRDTELLLNLNTPRLRMMAGFEDSEKKERDAKLRVVSAVLGEDPQDPEPEWLRAWRRIGDPVAWESWAVSSYMARLQSMSREIEHTVAYPIRETFRSSPKYFLVFATRSYKAIPIMNDILCIEEDDLFAKTETVAKNGQFTLFPALRDSERVAHLAALLDEMHAHGRAHQGCSRPQLIRYFLLQKFGQFKQKHYRQAMDKLVTDGRALFANGRANDVDPISFL